MKPKPSSHEPRRFIPNILSGENGHSDTLTLTGGIFSFCPLASPIFTLNIDQEGSNGIQFSMSISL